MARTNSILSEADWKRNFGDLLKMVAEHQNISAGDIGRHLDRLPGSSGRGRISDWLRYTENGRIPTEQQLDLLSQAIRVPRSILRLCVGYVDDIFECIHAVASGHHTLEWNFPIEPQKAALALLLSLFPKDEMYIGNPCSLFGWLWGKTVMLNLSPDEGVLSGPNWNAVWLYPMRSERHIMEHYERPDDPSIVWVGEPRTEPWTWYSMRALIQVDVASPLACTILKTDGIEIPKNEALFEAQRILHGTSLPLTMRIDHATDMVHYWANRVNRKVADELRECLHPWNERTITDEAARWVRGELSVRPTDFWV